MNILITGATGLVGKTLCTALEGHKIYPASSNNTFAEMESWFKRHPLDAIIHLANPPQWNHPSPLYYLPVNIIGTLQLLELARRKKAKFIFTSSQMVYGGKMPKKGFKETDPPHPSTWYGMSKHIAEQYIYAYRQKYQTSAVILRPGGIFGYKDTRTVLGSFIENARLGKNLSFNGMGKSERHFIHVDDVVMIIKKLLVSRMKLEIFNIASWKHPSIKEIAQYISQLSGVSIKQIGTEIRSDFYLHTTKLTSTLEYKADLFKRIKQELAA